MGAFSVKVTRAGEIAKEADYPNRWLPAATNYLLDTLFRATTPEAPFYIGLIGDQGFTGLSDSDTMASHPGWQEFTRYTGYPSGLATVRPEALSWFFNNSGYTGSPSGRGAVNARDDIGFAFSNGGSLASQFIVNSVLKLKAIFLTTGSAVGGTAGILLATAVVDVEGIEFRVGDAATVQYRHQLKTVVPQIDESI